MTILKLKLKKISYRKNFGKIRMLSKSMLKKYNGIRIH